MRDSHKSSSLHTFIAMRDSGAAPVFKMMIAEGTGSSLITFSGDDAMVLLQQRYTSRPSGRETAILILIGFTAKSLFYEMLYKARRRQMPRCDAREF